MTVSSSILLQEKLKTEKNHVKRKLIKAQLYAMIEDRLQKTMYPHELYPGNIHAEDVEWFLVRNLSTGRYRQRVRAAQKKMTRLGRPTK